MDDELQIREMSKKRILAVLTAMRSEALKDTTFRGGKSAASFFALSHAIRSIKRDTRFGRGAGGNTTSVDDDRGHEEEIKFRDIVIKRLSTEINRLRFRGKEDDEAISQLRAEVAELNRRIANQAETIQYLGTR